MTKAALTIHDLVRDPDRKTPRVKEFFDRIEAGEFKDMKESDTNERVMQVRERFRASLLRELL